MAVGWALKAEEAVELWVDPASALTTCVCRMTRRRIGVCFEPSYSPLWCSGLKVPTNLINQEKN